MEKIKEKILRYFDRTWEPRLHNKEVAQIMNRYEEDVIAIIDGKEPKGIAGLTLKESMLDYEYSTQQDLKSTILKKLPEENRHLWYCDASEIDEEDEGHLIFDYKGNCEKHPMSGGMNVSYGYNQARKEFEALINSL